MRILMVAPEPFFEPRGTPLSVYHRVKALAELGHDVHLVTYPVGEPMDLPGVRVSRCAGLPFLRRVKVGPSWAKIPLDLLLFARVVRELARGGYDCLHTHEEAMLVGACLRRLWRIPHVYDMHSSLPQQFENFGFTRSRAIINIWRVLERWAVKGSDLVVCISPSLEALIKTIDPAKPVLTIENPMLFEGQGVARLAVAETCRRLGLEGRRVVLYTGTFEAYQGVELLLEAAARVAEAAQNVRFVLVGGEDRQIAPMQALARRVGARDTVVFTGQRPLSEMPVYLEVADLLVSPRTTGINPPLKIYTYLASGRPIVATRIPAHTQVLNPDVALLTEPTPEGLAAGLLAMLEDTERAATLAKRARVFAEVRFGHAAYLTRVRQAYERLGAVTSKA